MQTQDVLEEEEEDVLLPGARHLVEEEGEEEGEEGGAAPALPGGGQGAQGVSEVPAEVRLMVTAWLLDHLKEKRLLMENLGLSSTLGSGSQRQ